MFLWAEQEADYSGFWFMVLNVQICTGKVIPTSVLCPSQGGRSESTSGLFGNIDNVLKG